MKYVSLENLKLYDSKIKEYIENTIGDIEDVLSYGVEIDTTVKDPHLTRIGNPLLHKSLPIQSAMKGCICQDDKIMYYLDADNWIWRKNPIHMVVNILSNTTLNGDIFSTLQYEKQWIKINGNPFQVISIDTSSHIATIKNDTPIELTVANNVEIEMGAVLNGYDGTVRVEVPEFWIRSEDNGDKQIVRIATQNINGKYKKQKHCVIDFTKATLLRKVPENMGYLSTLSVNSPVCIVNEHDYCRGGNNNANYDSVLETNPCQCNLKKGASSFSRASFRNWLKGRKSYPVSYNDHKNIICWLWWIEYASFYSQEGWNSALTSEGYHQGGCGNGVTDINWNIWTFYNANCCLTPSDYFLDAGNGNSRKAMKVFNFDVSITSNWLTSWSVNTNVINNTSGSNNGKTITTIKSISSQAFSTEAYNQFNTVTYVVSGLTDGQTVIFKQGNTFASSTEVLTIDTDGVYEISWAEPSNTGYRYISFGKIQSSCNILIYNSTRNTDTVHFPESTTYPYRWRGIDNPFGDQWNNLDGFIKRSWGKGTADIYICDEPEYYADAINEHYYKAGTEIDKTGYIKKFDIGTDAQIIPSVNDGNYNYYVTDYHWANGAQGLYTLRLGGDAGNGSFAGLCDFSSSSGVSFAAANVAQRTISYLDD